MILKEVYKHCVRTKKPRHYNHDWKKLGPNVWYRIVYYGVMNLDNYEEWKFNDHLDCWEYFTQSTEIDVLAHTPVFVS